ncbi:MAG: FkbM family methyltransferase [Nostoc sp.]|uniref:FkbM family methyltransferase n=1 Tax=Nostoc sp. TaxID=1180 RepID=UPI002FF62419
MYPYKALIPLYQTILNLTKGRGEYTLAKLDVFLFRSNRKIKISYNSDFYISLPPDAHFFRYLTKSHEQHISNAISKLVKNGDTVVDIGANIGYFSAYAASAVGKKGKIFCLEPEAKNFEYLKANCDVIKNHGFNCLAYNVAASSVNGEAVLSIHQYSTYHAIEDEFHHLDKVENKQIVSTVTLDQWTQEQGIQRISLLKIDTEGHEQKVLEGAIELFSVGAVDFVILECRSNEIGDFIDKFSQKFSLHQLTWDGHKWHQSKAGSLKFKTECLLSKLLVTPNALCY